MYSKSALPARTHQQALHDTRSQVVAALAVPTSRHAHADEAAGVTWYKRAAAFASRQAWSDHSKPHAAKKLRRGLALVGSSTCSHRSAAALYCSISTAWVCMSLCSPPTANTVPARLAQLP